MTTKDSAGPLPLTCYVNKEADPKSVDFAELAQGGQEIATEEEKAPANPMPQKLLFLRILLFVSKTVASLECSLHLFISPDLTSICMLPTNAKAKITLHKIF